MLCNHSASFIRFMPLKSFALSYLLGTLNITNLQQGGVDRVVSHPLHLYSLALPCYSNVQEMADCDHNQPCTHFAHQYSLWVATPSATFHAKFLDQATPVLHSSFTLHNNIIINSSSLGIKVSPLPSSCFSWKYL